MKSKRFIRGKDSEMVKKSFCLILIILLFTDEIFGQSFYQEKEPKTTYYRIGIGAGTYFAALRPSYEKIENQIVPVLSLGLGRKFNEHFSLKSTFSFQQFSSEELITQEETGLEILEPIFQGYNYALDVVPTFSFLPALHHMSRPIIGLEVGVGLGYLLTYRTEKFEFNEKNYEFSFFESSFYLPVRVSTVIKLGILSDLEIEGAFFYTFLNDSESRDRFEKDSDHFGQLNLVYRRYIR